MPLKIYRFRGGRAEKSELFTGFDRELTVNTTDKRVVLHDGIRQGGYQVAKQSEIPTDTAQLNNDIYHTKTSLTKLSQLNNDANYWKKSELTKVSQLENDKGYLTGHCSYCTYCTYCTNCS